MNTELLDRFDAKMRSIWKGARVLSLSIPGPIVATYVLALSYMNFFALKEFPLGKIAVIDCAFLLSWIPFIIADVLTKVLDFHAAVSMAIFGACCNFVFSLLMWFVTLIPSSFGLGSNPGMERAITEILGSHGLIILGSGLSLVVATGVKGYCMYRLDKKLKDSYSVKTVYIEVVVSSLIGQLVDNTMFAFFSWFLLFHWSFRTIVCSILIKTAFELFMEMICLPVGYISINQFRDDGIGKDYLKFIEGEKAKKLKQN